jgi:hypothetical protein
MPLGQQEEKDTRIFWSVLAWGLLLQPNLRTYFRSVIILDVTGNHKPNIKSYTTGELQLHGLTTGITAHSFPCYAGSRKLRGNRTSSAATCMVQFDQWENRHQVLCPLWALFRVLHGCNWLMVWTVHLGMHTAAAVRASAHGRFYAAVADFFFRCERNAMFSHFPHDMVQSVCALHKHKFYDHTIVEIWKLPDIYNDRLTQARRMCIWHTV